MGGENSMAQTCNIPLIEGSLEGQYVAVADGTHAVELARHHRISAHSDPLPHAAVKAREVPSPGAGCVGKETHTTRLAAYNFAGNIDQAPSQRTGEGVACVGTWLLVLQKRSPEANARGDAVCAALGMQKRRVRRAIGPYCRARQQANHDPLSP